MNIFLIRFRDDESIIIYGKVEKASNSIIYEGYVIDSNYKRIEIGRFVQYSINECVIENSVKGDKIELTHPTISNIEMIEEDDFYKIKVLCIKKRNLFVRFSTVEHYMVELKIDDKVKKIPCWAGVKQTSKDNLIHDIKRTLEIRDTLYYLEDFKFDFEEE